MAFVLFPVFGNVHASCQDLDSEEVSGLSDAEVMDGWISLFDGKSLYGWKPENKNPDWHAVDGEIRVSGGDAGLLRTTSQFDDFELRLEFNSPEGTNSGLFFRTSPKPKSPTIDCYELNIAPLENPFPTGSLVGRSRTESPVKPDQWNQLRLVAKGPFIQIWVNEQQVLTYEDPHPLGRGFIGLQKNEGPIRFRRIALRPLSVAPLFNGQDLTGWNSRNAAATQISVTPDNELQMVGGKGQIETNESYGDFIFSTQCKTQTSGVNTGVFFRCIPGEMMNGYESQIQNAPEADKTDEKLEWFTGSIFNRKKARRLYAKDNEWFAKTIVAVGPHIAVWVNGVQVCDWTDQRNSDPNPRRGCRLKPGTIILQGHDPTTNILFRKLQARELNARR